MYACMGGGRERERERSLQGVRIVVIAPHSCVHFILTFSILNQLKRAMIDLSHVCGMHATYFIRVNCVHIFVMIPSNSFAIMGKICIMGL